MIRVIHYFGIDWNKLTKFLNILGQYLKLMYKHDYFL